jgi:riboflavin synthase
MFTGIIEEIGVIDSVQQGHESLVLDIRAQNIMSDMHLGDSISIDGVCLTITSFSNHHFTLDVMPETVRSTTLKLLRKGSKVNLERAMGAGGRFGGHMLSGHVDEVGTIIGKKQVDNAIYYEIQVSEDARKYMIYKGSISVDGTSLTIFGLTEKSFTVSLIPHTLSESVLGNKRVGDIVNIECDMIGKYVEHFLKNRSYEASKKKSTISKNLLEEHGFL